MIVDVTPRHRNLSAREKSQYRHGHDPRPKEGPGWAVLRATPFAPPSWNSHPDRRRFSPTLSRSTGNFGGQIVASCDGSNEQETIINVNIFSDHVFNTCVLLQQVALPPAPIRPSGKAIPPSGR